MVRTRDIQHLTDEQLAEAYSTSGDKDYLGLLYQRFRVLILAICFKYLASRELAQDALMQVFEIVMEELPKTQVEKFRPWICTITRNHCLMELRKKQPGFVDTEILEKEGYGIMEFSSSPHLMDEPDQETRLQQLEAAITQLPEAQRECVALFFLQEKSYKEIMAITGMDYNQVKSHVQNGKRNLKLALTGNA